MVILISLRIPYVGLYGFLSVSIIFPETDVDNSYSVNGVSPLINSVFLDNVGDAIDLAF